MGIIIDTKPYLLYETIGMLVKHINRISMLDVQQTLQPFYKDGMGEIWNRRLECLEGIIAQVCQDVDREDAEFQYFFSRREIGKGNGETALALMMTWPFCEHGNHTLEGEARLLKDSWRKIQAKGYRLRSGMFGLSFLPREADQPQPSLFRQVYDLGLVGDFAMEILNVLQDFDSQMDRLVRLIAPYGRRLEEKLQENAWLTESLGEYWHQQFQHMTPEEFWVSSTVDRKPLPILPQRRVCFSLFLSSVVECEVEDSLLHPGESHFVFGSAIVVGCAQRMFGRDLDHMSAAFRVLGDRNRLKLLLRLAEGRGYCQQLALDAQCNTGNMSRNLTALSKCGFLKQEQEQSRTYYTTDLAGIKKLFRGFVELLERRAKS